MVGTFNVIRLAAQAMMGNEPEEAFVGGGHGFTIGHFGGQFLCPRVRNQASANA